LFAIGAVIVAALAPRRPLVLAGGFFATAIVLLELAWGYRKELSPSGWTDGDWYLWLFGFSPWGVSIQFAMGVLAWHLSRLDPIKAVAKAVSIAGAVVLVGIYAFCAMTYVTGHVTQSMIAGIGTALVMIGAQSDTVINRWLSTRPMLHIGMVSYSLYLFHFAVPGLGFGGEVAKSLDPATVLYWLVNFAACLAMAIMVATGVYHVVEVPGRRLIRKGADRLLGIRRQDAAPVQAPV
jgi:peptidoglycan/LPS O-acetylase OafA/YrhL